MKKIPTLFERDWNGDRSLVTREINHKCQWVFDGQGVATKKIDGTSCAIIDGKYFKRYETKKGNFPEGFIKIETDAETGKTFGWVPVGEGNEDKWHNEAYVDGLSDGTYELIGPKVQGNPELSDKHVLINHNSLEFEPVPRSYDEIKEFLKDKDVEGIVWHHPDGRMAKIKKRDFGFKRI